MFRRTFWFTAGAAAGVWATTKVNRKLRQLTPESLAAQAAEQGDRGRPPAQGRSPSTSGTAWPSARPNWATRSGSTDRPDRDLPAQRRRARPRTDLPAPARCEALDATTRTRTTGMRTTDGVG